MQLTGNFRADRHGDRVVEPVERVGEPPGYLPAAARRVWRETAAAAPWLRSADRGALEVYARLTAEMRANFTGMSAARITTMVNVGAKLGLNPRDRAHVEAALADPDDPDDPAAEWFM